MSRRVADRAVRELLNSVTVTKDLVEYRAHRSMARRVIDQVTGEDRRIAELLDDHSAQSIDNLLHLTTLLNERIAFSDETTVKLIRKFKETAKRLESHGVDIANFHQHIAALEDCFAREIPLLIERADSRDAIEHGFAWLELRTRTGSFNLTDFWQFADELWWGGFGLIQRRTEQSEMAARLRQEVVHRLQLLFKDKFGSNRTIPLQEMLGNTPALAGHPRDELDLLMLDPDWRSRPLSRAIADRASERVDFEMEVQSVPVVTTVDRLAERLLNEAKRAGEA
jgi:hypothetical protein